MSNSSVALLCIAIIACFSMEASAFQIGNKGRPHTNTVSISRLLPHVLSPMTSRLHSTPMTDLPFADTETKVSTTDFILSEIAINDVRNVHKI